MARVLVRCGAVVALVASLAVVGLPSPKVAAAGTTSARTLPDVTGLSEMAAGVSTLLTNLPGQGLPLVDSVQQLLQQGSPLQTAQTGAGDLTPIESVLQGLTSAGGPVFTALQALNMQGSIDFSLPLVGHGWFSRSGSSAAICMETAGPGQSVALFGIAADDPLCGGNGAQMADPQHIPYAFIDILTPDGHSYLDARVPLSTPDAMPILTAETYVSVGNNDWIQVKAGADTDASVNVQASLALSVAGSYVVEGQASAGVTLSVSVAPAALQQVTAGMTTAIANGLSAALGQSGDSTTPLSAEQAGTVLFSGLQYLQNYQTDSPGTLGTASIGIDVSGQLGFGVSNTTLTLLSGTAGASVSVPLDDMVSATGNGLAAMVNAGLQLASAQEQFENAQAGNTSAAVQTANLDSVVQPALAAFAALLATGQQADLNLNTSIDLLGSGSTSATGGDNAGTSVNLFRATAQIPFLPLLTAPVTFLPGTVGGLLQLTEDAIHQQVPAEIPSDWTDQVNSALVSGTSFTLQIALLPGLEVQAQIPGDTAFSAALTAAAANQTLLAALNQSAATGSLQPLQTVQLQQLFDQTVSGLRTKATFGLLFGAGTGGTLGVGGAVAVSGGAELYLQTTPQMLLFLSDPSTSASSANPGQADVGLDLTLGASASGSTSGDEGVQLQGTISGSASTSLLRLDLREWDQSPPDLLNYVQVAGFRVRDFQGTIDDNGHPSGSGYLELPLGGEVRVVFTEDADGHVTGRWDGSFTAGSSTFTAASGTLDDAGLHWQGDVAVLGSQTLFDLTMNAAGALSGTYHGNLTFGGVTAAADLTLGGSGIHGTANAQVLGSSVALTLGPNDFSTDTTVSAAGVSIPSHLTLGAGGFSGTGSLTVAGYTMSDVAFTINGSGAISGSGSLDAGGVHLYSKFSAGSGGFSLSGAGSVSLSLNIPFNPSFQGGVDWSGNDQGLSASVSGEACLSYSLLLPTGPFQLSWVPQHPCISLSQSGSLQISGGMLNLSFTIAGIPINASFPLPSSLGSPTSDTTPPSSTGSVSPAADSQGWSQVPVVVTLSASDAVGGNGAAPSGVAAAWYQLDGGSWRRYGGPITVGSDGRHVLEYDSTDNAGNTEAAHALSFNIDQTAPATTAAATPGANPAGWNNTAVTVTLNPSDDASGVAETQYNLDAAGWVPYAAAVTITAEGHHTLQYRSTDNAGNIEPAKSLSLAIDLSAPKSVATISGTQGSNGWFKAGIPVQLTLSATDATLGDGTAPAGVTKTQYRVNGGADLTYSAPLTFPDGVYQVEYASTDRAGNLEKANTVAIKVDQTPPQIIASAKTADGRAYAGGTWTNQDVTVSFTCTDNLSEIGSCPPAQSIVTEGAHQSVSGQAVDVAGNTASTTFAGIDIDRTPPQTVAAVTPTANGAGWNDSPVTVTFSATDNLSGVAKTEDNLDGAGWVPYTAAVTIGAEGHHTLQYRSFDNAGNVEASKSLTLAIDLTPPQSTAAQSGIQGENGWFKAGSPMQLTLSASDPTLTDGTAPSGVVLTQYRVNGGPWLTYSAPVSFVDGIYTVDYAATDGAGNQEATRTTQFQVDQTPPVTTATPNPGPDAYGWNKTTVDVALVATDNLSGVALTQYNLDGAGWTAYTGPVAVVPEGVHTLLYRSTDIAGNVESTRSLTVRVDLTPPEANLSFDPQSLDLQVVGTDGLAGVPDGGVRLTATVAAKWTEKGTDVHLLGGDEHASTVDAAVYSSVYASVYAPEGGSPALRPTSGTALRTYLVSDRAENTLGVQVLVSFDGRQMRARIVSLSYNGAAPVAPPDGQLHVEWHLDRSGTLGGLTEEVVATDPNAAPTRHGPPAAHVSAAYDSRRGETNIQGPDPGRPATQPGLVLLTLRTQQGVVYAGS